MSLSPDRVVVFRADWMHACIAGRFLRFTLIFQAKKTELMAALQSVIAVVHPVAYLAFLHVCRVLGDLCRSDRLLPFSSGKIAFLLISTHPPIKRDRPPTILQSPAHLQVGRKGQNWYS